jgi:hypothetical protein
MERIVNVKLYLQGEVASLVYYAGQRKKVYFGLSFDQCEKSPL